MPLEQLLALAGFVIVMVGTPGPNNMMLLVAGANFGFRRSLPHIMGITAGCQFLMLAVALGLGRLLTVFPQLHLLLKVVCALVLIYLAWLLVQPALTGSRPSTAPQTATTEGGPLSFWQGAMFQWVNPKAWMMMVTAIATYTQPERPVTSTLIIGLLFALLGLPLITIWNLFGASLKDWLQDPLRARVFNLAMAVLLLASMIPLLG